ncbi:SNAP25 homologous protein SNAP33-like [Magnolia sinica]|uniref:SNAP25 homologous protein SNAP33-like n=1 Tax=Magnolia sinica TaxID=86752 RepID=UPI00265B1AFE|nr:SNAP25 homologous protein SNAP33-like [Magnolia sinica]
MTKTPIGKNPKQRSVESGFSASSNPFDSDSDSDIHQTSKPGKASSAPITSKANSKTTPSNDDASGGASSAAKNRYKNGFHDSGGLENQTVQELENYAVYKAEETTKAVNGCLKIAEDIREDATNTLITLHQQGEQITRTHMTAANIDHDLSMGEKLLGSLGGMFSKTWKPKKARAITGPVITRDDSFKRRGNHLEQRERLGLARSPKGKSNARQNPSAPSTALEQVEVEKAKQDDGLLDLSNVLDQLKDMAVDMGTEIERQNKALDHLHDDVEELNSRVKGANQRGRRLLGK